MTDKNMHRFVAGCILQLLPALILAMVCSVFTGCSSPTKSSVDGPDLDVDTNELSFGSSLTEQTISISNNGSGSLEWSVFVPINAPWCIVEPGSGSGSSTITVTVDRTQMLSPGDYTTVITVNSNGGVSELSVEAISSSGIIIIDTPLPE